MIPVICTTICMMIKAVSADRAYFYVKKKEDNKVKELKNKMKKQWIRGKAVIFKAMAFLFILGVNGRNAYASSFKGSIYETGTKKMMKDLLSVGQGVAGAIVLALWILWEIQKRAGEENEEGKYSKKQKGAIIGLIIAETISTFVGIVGGYYGILIK